MEQRIDRNESILQLNLLPAGLSLIFPGLGQLFQRRAMFVVHMLLYALSLFILFLVCGAEADFWTVNGFVFFKIYEGALFFAVLSSILPLLTVLFSVLDAATWRKDSDSLLQKQFVQLGISIVVVALLLIVVLPMIAAAREAARRMQCSSNLKQIGLALHSYHDEYQCFPPAYTVDQDGEPLHSWRVLILPYLEEKELYENIRLEEPWNSEHNRQFHDRFLPIYRCPSSNLKGITKRLFPKLHLSETCFYSVVVGKDTIFPRDKTSSFNEITDGISNTILVVERILPICWMDPNNEIQLDSASLGVNCNCFGVGSAHYRGASVVFADGGTRFISDSIDPQLFRSLFTKDGGEK